MIGPHDMYFEKYDEHISFTKQSVMAKNLIFGGLYLDVDGTNESLNHKTGEKAEIKFISGLSGTVWFDGLSLNIINGF